MLTNLRAALPTVLTYAASGAAAYIAFCLHFRLAWLLVPLVISAGMALSDVTLISSTWLRRFGQLTIGAAVGLNMTPPVLLELLNWLPVMIAIGLASIIVSAFFSILLRRFANIDAKSAFFASLPGGLAEMGNVGAQVGAHPEPIAIVQTIRIALVVLIVPPVLVSLGLTSGAVAPATPPISWVWVPALLMIGAIGALIFRLLNLNNPWMVGSLIGIATATATGQIGGHMPQPVFQVAQLLMGFAVGARFRPTMIHKLPRVTIAGIASTVAVGAVMLVVAAILAGVSTLDLPTAMLATSPGGTSEMAATAQILHLDVAAVVAFQVIRAILVNGLATYYWSILSRFGFFTSLGRQIGVASEEQEKPRDK